jgi:hypothetical protein
MGDIHNKNKVGGKDNDQQRWWCEMMVVKII